MKMVWRKSLGHVVPVDKAAQDFLSKVPNGDLVMMEGRRARNVRHHRKLFLLLNLVIDNTERYPDVDTLLFALKIATGYCDPFPSADGKTIYMKPRSISFESMSQDEFEPWYDRVVNIIVSQVIPGIGREDLLDEVASMLEPA